MKIKIYFVIGIFFFITTGLFPQQKLSLKDAIGIALKNNYDIKLAQSDLEISDKNFSLGNAGFLPKLDVTGSLSKTVTTTKQEYSTGQSVDKTNSNSTSTLGGIALTWTLFDGFKMFTSYSKLREYKELGEVKLRSQIENSLSDLIKTYYDIARQKYNLRVAQESIDISAERLRLAEERFSVGSSSQLDVLRAKVDLNADKSNFLTQEVVLNGLKVVLNSLLARTESTEFDVDETIDIKLGLQFDQLKESTFSNNADLQQAVKNKNLSSYDITLSRADYFPKISLSGGYNYSNLQADAGFFKSNSSSGYNYGLNLSWNLFNGFTTQLAYETALITADKNETKFQQIKNLVISNLMIAFQYYQKNLEILKLEEENVSVSKENLDLAIEQLKLGSLSPIEFRDVQKNYITAQSRLSSARYTAKMSEKDLLKQSGLLSPKE